MAKISRKLGYIVSYANCVHKMYWLRMELIADLLFQYSIRNINQGENYLPSNPGVI
jgi:hypothetical protein